MPSPDYAGGICPQKRLIAAPALYRQVSNSFSASSGDINRHSGRQGVGAAGNIPD
uniref:Uncharacterized protein n=1 Tax=Erwinia amylovora ATCC BAA-2158 TaxID=889211 RepID=E5B4E9_ERWAM|nr:hypothetical protein predicted by Glimmer/Critica [Erwinia amylovora ATCC BAA-2158]